MKNYCYFNGKITTVDKIKISPYDIGVLRGYGVFDVMCTENGKPFLLDEHWLRLTNSAKELKLQIPISKKEFREIVEKIIKKNGYKKNTIRTVLTGGVGNPRENAFLPNSKKKTFYILVEKFVSLPRVVFQEGAKIITVDYKRHIPWAKITNYVEAIKNNGRKSKEKALEIVYINKKNILEASSSNLFIVKNGRIVTTHKDILHGITRNLVIKLAKKLKIKIIEREIKISEALSADEVFLTATNKFIVPIIKIDQHKIGNGKIGEVTNRLMEEFDEFVKKY
jgi:D-amino acid aminotransferase